MSLIGFPIIEKLTKTNLVFWKAKVLPTIREVQLKDLLDATATPSPKEVDDKDGDRIVKVPNPDYTKWVALDQQVLSYLLTTMSREGLAQVATAKTAAELWNEDAEVFLLQM